MPPGALLGIANAATLGASVPIVGYSFRPGSRLDPYRSRGAKWTVFIRAGVGLALFVVLAQRR